MRVYNCPSRMPIRMCMQKLLQVLFIFCFGGIFTLIQKSSLQWDYLVYTQIWPQATCIEINETQPKHGCVIPDDIKTWTIHGLWPTSFGKRGPNYCNDSWPFRPDEIKDLLAELNLHWPNFIPSEGETSFWKHEWTKHGTCAASLPSLNSEHKYFSTGLKLQQRFNLQKTFSQAGLVPSSNVTYTLEDFRDALKGLTPKYPRIMCMEAKDKQSQAIAQIEICIDKAFELVDCDDSKIEFGRSEETKQFTRLRRSSETPKWDQYPYYPEFSDCSDSIPIKYLPIQQGYAQH